jgi:HNH endonuclease
VSISPNVRQLVREKANFCCEYCGTSETESGGDLTLDHFQPQSKNGKDEEENLIYCCFRCNLYKSDYWTDNPNQTPLFNPRNDKFEEHFWFSESGKLLALTVIGETTVKLLRLNRQPLVTKRRQDYQQTEERQILQQSQKTVELLIILSRQQRELLIEQQTLLEEQRRLIDFLFRK